MPKLKFTMVGDFEQLPPVKCRLGNTCFKDSKALWELCDGSKLTLTICRRSDDTSFNMVAPDNTSKIKKASFGNEFTDRHVSYTNARRIQVNKQMIDIYLIASRIPPGLIIQSYTQHVFKLTFLFCHTYRTAVELAFCGSFSVHFQS